jgi:hypothetical protein
MPGFNSKEGSKENGKQTTTETNISYAGTQFTTRQWKVLRMQPYVDPSRTSYAPDSSVDAI